MKIDTDDILNTHEAEELLGRRIEPYVRQGRIEPVMRGGPAANSAMFFRRSDVEVLRKEAVAKLRKLLARSGG